MSNWIIVGIIGIITVICCVVTAKLTGNERKTLMGGIFALISAGGFGYAIAYLVRKGLEGPYLTVAVLVGIIVPILIFLTIYNVSKETSPKGSKAERTIDDKIRAVEEDRQNLKKAAKEIDNVKKQMDFEKEIFEKDKGNLEVLRKKIEKERALVEEEKELLAEGKLKLAPEGRGTAPASEPADFSEERAVLLKEFEREKEQKEQSFEEERQKLIRNMEEEKRKLQQAFAQEKKKLDDASPLAAAEEASKKHLEHINELEICINELEQQEAAAREEQDSMKQMLRELNQQQRKMKEETEDAATKIQTIEDEKIQLTAALEQSQRESEEVQQTLEREHRALCDTQAALETERANVTTALDRVRALEQQIREREQEEERRRQEAKTIRENTAKSYEYENVIEKGRALQKRGLYQLAITLYEEWSLKLQDENQKQQLLKEMAGCYMDAGETSKAKKLLAKR